jgi:hypothetical protein
MARNIFASEFAQGNWVPAAQAGIDFANQFDDRIRSRRASTRAAPMIASGDYQGAAGVYGEAGLADDALTLRGEAEGLQRQGRLDERQAMQDKRQAKADERAAAAEVVEVWKGAAGNLLKRYPTDPKNPMATAQQRFEAFTQTPIYRNFTPEQRLQVVVEDFTDDGLRQVVTEVEKTYQQMFQNKYGFFGARPDGKIDTLMELPQEPIAVSQGVTLLDPKTRRPIYTNPKTFASPGRGRAGAGAGAPGAASSVIPDSDVEPM